MKKVKHICDRCKKEIDLELYPDMEDPKPMITFRGFEICYDCYPSVHEVIRNYLK